MSRNSIKAIILFGIIILSSVLFWVAYHNLDLVHNMMLVHADTVEGGYSEFRDMSDCNISGCTNYTVIYLQSIVMQGFAFLMLFGTVVWLAVRHD